MKWEYHKIFLELPFHSSEFSGLGYRCESVTIKKKKKLQKGMEGKDSVRKAILFFANTMCQNRHGNRQ